MRINTVRLDPFYVFVALDCDVLSMVGIQSNQSDSMEIEESQTSLWGSISSLPGRKQAFSSSKEEWEIWINGQDPQGEAATEEAIFGEKPDQEKIKKRVIRKIKKPSHPSIHGSQHSPFNRKSSFFHQNQKENPSTVCNPGSVDQRSNELTESKA